MGLAGNAPQRPAVRKQVDPSHPGQPFAIKPSFQITEPQVQFWDTVSDIQRGADHFLGRYLQCKKIHTKQKMAMKKGHLLKRLFQGHLFGV